MPAVADGAAALIPAKSTACRIELPRRLNAACNNSTFLRKKTSANRMKCRNLFRHFRVGNVKRRVVRGRLCQNGTTYRKFICPVRAAIMRICSRLRKLPALWASSARNAAHLSIARYLPQFAARLSTSPHMRGAPLTSGRGSSPTMSTRPIRMPDARQARGGTCDNSG